MTILHALNKNVYFNELALASMYSGMLHIDVQRGRAASGLRLQLDESR